MLAVAILAAGKGTRMKSSCPKVLHQLAGKTLIERVLASCCLLKPVRKIIVLGHQANEIKEALKDHKDLEFVLQEPQKGTGHAVQQLTTTLNNFKGDLLVLNGDVPLIKATSIQRLVEQHCISKSDISLLSTRMNNPKGYGRVFAEENGKVTSIIEDKDCSKQESNNKLINAGVYCFNWEKLTKILPDLSNKNEQGEIYLTETISKADLSIHIEVTDPKEVSGVNNKIQLAECETFLQKRLRNFWMKEGVTFIDPASCTLSEECHFDSDVIIEPQTHFRGKCKIGKRCKIGPTSFLKDVEIGNNVEIVQSVLNDTKISDNVEIGPFAHIRPKCQIQANCRIGNFVEIKKSKIDQNCKINHLSYIGDATLYANVNIGAGTITANYDGKNKHQTTIGEGSKTGANSVLVAPINIGSSVTIGAGSTLSKDVPDFSLAIARAKQTIKKGWK